jgi:hypothetical protein
MVNGGLILDQHDDLDQSLLKRIFTQGEMPSLVKQAHILSEDQLAGLPNQAFALRAMQDGRFFRKFATVDRGTTALSVIYFLENKDHLPEEAQKFAAANLVQACDFHEMQPPKPLVDLAGAYQPDALIDISGKRPRTKVAAPGTNVVLDSQEKVAAACQYFEDNYGNMHPRERHLLAMPLLKAAEVHGADASETLQRYGAQDYAPSLRLGFTIRDQHLDQDDEIGHGLLKELFEKASSVEPHLFAEALAEWDKGMGFDQYWDRGVPDPWFSTFGQTKIAEYVYVDGVDRVTGTALQKMALNPILLYESFDSEIVEAFKKDPITIFESMPITHKRIMMRAAMDSYTGGVNTRHGS